MQQFIPMESMAIGFKDGLLSKSSEYFLVLEEGVGELLVKVTLKLSLEICPYPDSSKT